MIWQMSLSKHLNTMLCSFYQKNIQMLVQTAYGYHVTQDGERQLDQTLREILKRKIE